MCAACSGIESLKITCSGSTAATVPSAFSVKPEGAFIHALAATTDILPKIPASTMGTPVQKCAHGFSRRQPKI